MNRFANIMTNILHSSILNFKMSKMTPLGNISESISNVKDDPY